jgi:hypothetical protein
MILSIILTVILAIVLIALYGRKPSTGELATVEISSFVPFEPERILRNEDDTMSRLFRLPADQPDFEILLNIKGKDSEGNLGARVAGVTVEVENTNEAAIVGTLVSSTPNEAGDELNCVVNVHVADPSADLGVISYKAFNAQQKLVGVGADSFLINVGDLDVAEIVATVPFVAEPDTPVPPVTPPANETVAEASGESSDANPAAEASGGFSNPV